MDLTMDNTNVNVQAQDLPILRITHKVSVESIHKLNYNCLTLEQNLFKFGKSNLIHGHKYKFKVTFKSIPISNFTGEINGNELLEDCLNLAIIELLDKKNLDTEVSWFKTRPSTLENIVLFVWRNVSIITQPHPVELEEIKVKIIGSCTKSSTNHSSTEVTYRGETVTVPVQY